MNRRRVLTRIVQGFSLTGLGFLIYPFVKSILPKFDQNLNLEVSVGDLQPGQSRRILWRGRNLIIIKRSDEVIHRLADSNLPLKDPDSSQSIQPNSARNNFRSKRADLFVSYTNCTHLGCEVALSNKKGIGFACPCHQSEYDQAGRVLDPGAALYNLEVPAYRFLSRNLIRLEAEKS